MCVCVLVFEGDVDIVLNYDLRNTSPKAYVTAWLNNRSEIEHDTTSERIKSGS